jgi:hypothetical protein
MSDLIYPSEASNQKVPFQNIKWEYALEQNHYYNDKSYIYTLLTNIISFEPHKNAYEVVIASILKR